MKLVRARVQNYRSVEDSGWFDIDRLTCLVGKNEAGKTAILSALRGLKPIQAFEFDVTKDYPRRYVTRFDERHPDGRAEVISTAWELDAEDVAAVETLLGSGVLKSRAVQLQKGYNNEHRFWTIEVDEAKALANKIQTHALDATERNIINSAQSSKEAIDALVAAPQRTAKQVQLLEDLKKFREGGATLAAIDLLEKRVPGFYYTSHYERMSGEIAVDHLQRELDQGRKIKSEDQIFLDFLAYAGTSLKDLKEASKREELKAICEAASNEITSEIFQFWSQNAALDVVIDFDQARSGDPAPFNAGTIAQIRIRNVNHRATLPLSERSAGFVWFFSFLAQYKQLRKTSGNAIVLLDEPGLTLHGRAQGDLLKYIVERLLPAHQVIYSTHSPFMVPAGRLEDVRIVEDVLQSVDGKPVLKGTKIRADVLEVDKETLFPLQGALGYEITQTLFVGQNTLLVEGPSDIVYLQAMSQALRSRARKGLSSKWTVCPSGGIDKIAPFVRLFAGNKLNVAVLADVHEGDKGKLRGLREAEVLKAGQLFTVADLLTRDEADIEDLLHPPLFVRLLNSAFALVGSPQEITVAALEAADTSTRLVKKAETLFRTMPVHVPEFGHYAPAEWLMRNPAILDGNSPEVLETLDRFEKVFMTYNGMLPA